MDHIFLFETDARPEARAFATLRPKVLRDEAQVEAAFAEDPDALWIAFDGRAFLRALARIYPPRPHARARLLMLDRACEPDFFRAAFERVVVSTTSFLSSEELAEVLSAPNAADLFIGGRADPIVGVVLLFRGSLTPLVVPLSAFPTGGGRPQPDLSRFAVTDYGQTVKLGDYEAAADAILYEADPEYRRKIRKRRRDEEQGFGSSLRRLRILRGLRQSDFAGLSEKEIGRLERGEVAKPHGETLQKIAKRLRVRPDEIEEY